MTRFFRTAMGRSLSGVVVLATLAFAAAPARAQLPSASAPSLGMAGNYLALARGFNSVAWNPAGLAMSDNPGFSFTLLQGRLDAGIGPIELADIKDYEDAIIPPNIREQWLQEVEADGGEQGDAGAEITFAALSAGRIGLQVGTTVHSSLNLDPAIVELVLFGNAGRTGEPTDLTFSQSSVDAFALSTAALSYAQPLSTGFAIGATFKYVIGHALVIGRDNGGSASADPLRVEIDFPIVHTTSEDQSVNNGSGIGLDLGVAWENEQWSFGATVQNVFNSFEWDVEKLDYRRGYVLFDENNNVAEGDTLPFEQAPPALQTLVSESKIKPLLAAGVAFRPTSMLTLAADFRTQTGDGMQFGPKSHIGVGAELRLLPFLPLRAGFAKVTDGSQLGAGASLELGGFSINASAGRRKAGSTSDLLAVGVSIGTN